MIQIEGRQPDLVQIDSPLKRSLCFYSVMKVAMKVVMIVAMKVVMMVMIKVVMKVVKKVVMLVESLL